MLKMILLNGEKIANNTSATKQQINGPGAKPLNYNATSKGRLCSTEMHKERRGKKNIEFNLIAINNIPNSTIKCIVLFV